MDPNCVLGWGLLLLWVGDVVIYENVLFVVLDVVRPKGYIIS